MTRTAAIAPRMLYKLNSESQISTVGGSVERNAASIRLCPASPKLMIFIHLKIINDKLGLRENRARFRC